MAKKRKSKCRKTTSSSAGRKARKVSVDAQAEGPARTRKQRQPQLDTISIPEYQICISVGTTLEKQFLDEHGNIGMYEGRITKIGENKKGEEIVRIEYPSDGDSEHRTIDELVVQIDAGLIDIASIKNANGKAYPTLLDMDADNEEADAEDEDVRPGGRATRQSAEENVEDIRVREVEEDTLQGKDSLSAEEEETPPKTPSLDMSPKKTRKRAKQRTVSIDDPIAKRKRDKSSVELNSSTRESQPSLEEDADRLVDNDHLTSEDSPSPSTKTHEGPRQVMQQPRNYPQNSPQDIITRDINTDAPDQTTDRLVDNDHLTSEDSPSPSTKTHEGPPKDIIRLLLSNKTLGCTCQRGHCLKLYCECFAASALCNSKCKCTSCKNILETEKDITRTRSNALYRNPRAFRFRFGQHPRNYPQNSSNFHTHRVMQHPRNYPENSSNIHTHPQIHMQNTQMQRTYEYGISSRGMRRGVSHRIVNRANARYAPYERNILQNSIATSTSHHNHTNTLAQALVNFTDNARRASSEHYPSSRSHHPFSSSTYKNQLSQRLSSNSIEEKIPTKERLRQVSAVDAVAVDGLTSSSLRSVCSLPASHAHIDSHLSESSPLRQVVDEVIKVEDEVIDLSSDEESDDEMSTSQHFPNIDTDVAIAASLNQDFNRSACNTTHGEQDEWSMDSKHFVECTRIAIGKYVCFENMEMSFVIHTQNQYIALGLDNKHKLQIDVEDVEEILYYMPNRHELGTTTSSNNSGELQKKIRSNYYLILRAIPSEENGLATFTSNKHYYKSMPKSTPTKSTQLAKRYIVIESNNQTDFKSLITSLKQNDRLGMFFIYDNNRLSPKNLEREIISILKSKKPICEAHETALVFPSPLLEMDFDSVAVNLIEPNGKLSRNHESMFTNVAIKEKAPNRKQKNHIITIRGEDYDRLAPGEFLNDTLIDFWISWLISRMGNISDQVHVFTTQFYTKLEKEGVESIVSWTAKKNIDIFEKKYVFIPVNKDLHWSLLVIVNPGNIVSYSDEEACNRNLENPYILFMDSLRAHKKRKLQKNVHKWLNAEAARLDKFDRKDPYTALTCPVENADVPIQTNCWDCGVFVCRYAFAMLHLLDTHIECKLEDWREPKFRSEIIKQYITGTKAFDFGMDDIARLREEMAILIQELHTIYKQKIEEKKSKKKKKAKKHPIQSQLTF